MFIQQSCGCIGLLTKDSMDQLTFHKIIDCRREDDSITFYDDTPSMEYRRYRQLNDDETNSLLQLINVAFIESDKYRAIRSAMELPNDHRIKIQKQWDNTCIRNQTFKSFDEMETIKQFPLDDRDQEQIDKEVNRIQLLCDRENKKLDHWPDPFNA